MWKTIRLAVIAALVITPIGAGCGSDDDDSGSGGSAGTGGRPEQTGSSCTQAAQCYPNIEAGALAGTVACLPVTGGYCTHECQSDEDCCKIAGECKTNIREVCSPFESTGKKYCFLSCEDADVQRAAVTADGSLITDGTQFCVVEASAAFTCRSTGGGVQNRQVCLP